MPAASVFVIPRSLKEASSVGWPCKDQDSSQSDPTHKIVKYPFDEANQRVRNWIRHSSTIIMSAPSETHSDDQSNLGDSAYEFIDTDSESRDGGNTESIASTDFGRPEDDVTSLAGTEHTDDEEEQEENPPHDAVPTFNGFDDLTDTPTVGQSAVVFLDDIDRPLVRSIEFDEPWSLGNENVSVKHTIAEFNEAQTVVIADRMLLHTPPQRMLATICQTMTRQSLSVFEPFRILYVGSPHAKQDIIQKIGSSVAAPGGNDQQSTFRGHRPSQVYNVVPVTAFGSEKAPEVDLIESSDFQIKVDDCCSAVNLKYEGEDDRPDTITLTIGDNFSYNSVPDNGDFIIQPDWDLPHIAIIYCSGNDTAEMRRTRTFAKTFMSRHGVPVIVISHKQLFERSMGCMSLDQHALHMCLESRDPNGPRNIIHQRLPIDLASFMNIDARQMNRNLAFLTGLYDVPKPAPAPSVRLVPTISSDIEKTSYSLSDSVNFLRTRTGAEWRALVPVGVLLLSVFATVLTGINTYRTVPNSAVSINGALTQTSPMSAIPFTESSSISSKLSALSTATETSTSTKTVTVTYAQSVIPNSLSILPPNAMAKLREEPQIVIKPKSNQASDVSVEVCGARDVLIRIPSATKLSWLAKEAMSINVTRSNETVETERVYSSNDGIILHFPRNEAYGVLNISIITTKKPKVNESFEIDFGHKWQHDLEETVGKWSAEVYGNFLTSFQQRLDQLRQIADHSIAQTQALISAENLERFENVQHQAIESTVKYAERVKAFSLDLVKRSARATKEIGTHAEQANEQLQTLREPIEGMILRAQIMSRVYWLRLQGRVAEAEAYGNKAKTFLQEKLKGNGSLFSSKHAKKRDALRSGKRKCHKCGAKGGGVV